ncbi:MAG: hypothetical protein LUQ69_09090 [Methanoregulaceae archaeon]|nr:hypothetical protein [Methanoregulaceae archaeon]
MVWITFIVPGEKNQISGDLTVKENGSVKTSREQVVRFILLSRTGIDALRDARDEEDLPMLPVNSSRRRRM